MDLDPTFAAWFAVARFVHIGACLLLLGVWVFDRLVVAHARRRWRATNLSLTWNRIAEWLVLLAISLSLVSGAAWFALVAMNMSDAPWREALQPDVLKLVAFGTEFGRAWVIHGGLLAIACVAAIAWRLSSEETAKAAIAWINGVVAASVVGGIAWAGHGATGPAPMWHRAADVAHLLIAGVWPTGLAPLALLLWRLRRSGEIDARSIAPLIQRFSNLSFLSVVLLIASGWISSWCLVGSFQGLWFTPYGRCLLVKLILFAAMLPLAAWNMLVLRGRLVRAANAAEAEPPLAGRTVGQLRTLVMIEVVLGLLVLADVALLGLMAPGRV